MGRYSLKSQGTRTLVFLAVALLGAAPGDAQDVGRRKEFVRKLRNEDDSRRPIEVLRALREARAEELDAQGAEDFRVSDSDGNGWLSYREARAALGMERDDFRRFDLNNDGRFGPMEFGFRYESLLDRTGAAKAPVVEEPELAGPIPYPPPPPAQPEPYPTEEDLLRIYDKDRSRGLDEAEIATLFGDVGLELSAQVVATQLDPDDSDQLEVDELRPLASLVRDTLPQEDEPAPARLIEDLYGSVLSVAPSTSRPQAPPRIPAPADPFRRLDLFDDGFIDPVELQELLPPTRLSVRPAAIVSALDGDGDGRLSRLEFEASFAAGP